MKFSLIKNILLALFSLALTLVLIEIGLRIFWMPEQVSGWGWEDSPRRTLADFPDDSPNNFGLRGQAFEYSPDDFVVVLLGDSQVESATSAPENMPEKLLESELSKRLGKSVKVFSLAASGWGQDQQLLALQKYYDIFRADLVLVWSTPGNDFWESAFADRSTRGRAGHIKPTFLLRNQELLGPYFSNGFFYDFALSHLISSAYCNYQEQLLEEVIVKDWLKKLPKPHTQGDVINEKDSCSGYKQVSIKEYVSEIFSNKNMPVTIATPEDFKGSRSHFSPYAVNKSPRDTYLIELSRKLYEEIESVASKHGSAMFAFYGIREDVDTILRDNAKCIIDKDSSYFKIDYNRVAVLKDIIPAENLILFELPGREELVVSKTDLHLSDLGNKSLSKILSARLAKVIH